MPARGKLSDGWETNGGGARDTIDYHQARTLGRIRNLEVEPHTSKGISRELFAGTCNAADGAGDSAGSAVCLEAGAGAHEIAGAHPHLFDEVMDVGAASHVRFNIFPDGCVSGLRVYGTTE